MSISDPIILDKTGQAIASNIMKLAYKISDPTSDCYWKITKYDNVGSGVLSESIYQNNDELEEENIWALSPNQDTPDELPDTVTSNMDFYSIKKNYYEIPNNSEDPILFAFKSTEGVAETKTFTADSARNVFAIALGSTMFSEGYNQAHNVTITTTGEVYAGKTVETNDTAPASKIGVIFDGQKIYKCEHIKLGVGDTITFSSTATTRFTSYMYLIVDANVVPTDFNYVLSQLCWVINGGRSYSKNVTIGSGDVGRCLVVACIISNYMKANPGTTNIKLNDTAIDNIYQKQIGTYSYLSLAEVDVEDGDIINLSATSADQTIGYYLILRPTFE